MKRPITKTEYIVGAFFALTALLPLATTEDGYTIDVLPPLASVSDGSDLMTDHLSMRRLITQAMEICERRGVECPDVNDYDALRRFVRGVPALHEAAPEADTDGSMTILDLTDTQKGMLRRFQRVRVCPDSIDSILPGFFELCSKLLDETTGVREPIDRSVPVDFFPTLNPTLDQLIQMRNPN